ncbi:MAG: DUF1583 domain-containing protein, partial [Planctomycetaceae bacterium]|nr:DUF1583 domain-containing protein [Planctomycetaceae bacterium]
DYANGGIDPLWVTDEKSELQHVCGISNDQIWFRYPLRGDFEVQLEAQDGKWGDPAILANGLRFAAKGQSKAVDVDSQQNRDWVHFSTETVQPGKWNRHIIRFQGESVTYFLNDTPIYQEPRDSAIPWIAMHSSGRKTSTFRNIRIAGTPQIAREVVLLSDDALRGWNAFYFYQPLPTANISKKAREPKGKEGQSYRSAPKPNQLGQLAWSLKAGELISGTTKRQNATGPLGQSVIRYDRPLGEGETLTYEFFFEAGKTAVHPSIGRTAYMLHPEGLKRHWMTEVGGRWKLPKDYEAPLDKENPQKLPLKEGAWNRVSLQLNKSHQLEIRLNDEIVFDQEIEVLPQGTIFGLFHYADRTAARVRNIKLTGPWPAALPEELFTRSE